MYEKKHFEYMNKSVKGWVGTLNSAAVFTALIPLETHWGWGEPGTFLKTSDQFAKNINLNGNFLLAHRQTWQERSSSWMGVSAGSAL